MSSKLDPLDKTSSEMTGSTLPRRSTRKTKYQKEKEWMGRLYKRPDGIPGFEKVDNLKEFERIIWDNPADTILSKYDHTPDEMASLCGEGRDGWLFSSQIDWILNKLNNQQNKSLNVVLNFCSINHFKNLKDKMGDNVERLNFIVNVGMSFNGSVYVADLSKSGNHWVLISLDLSCNPTVLYCDSLGWKSPTNLLELLSQYTAVFGINRLERLVMMHVPTDAGHSHQCTASCKNYPLQTCSNVCGLVAVVCAVIYALDKPLFNIFCQRRSNLKLFLHDPTSYEVYLRRVVISWFIEDDVNTSLLKICPIQLDHSYAHTVLNGRKRKSVTPLDFPVETKSDIQKLSLQGNKKSQPHYHPVSDYKTAQRPVDADIENPGIPTNINFCPEQSRLATVICYPQTKNCGTFPCYPETKNIPEINFSFHRKSPPVKSSSETTNMNENTATSHTSYCESKDKIHKNFYCTTCDKKCKSRHTLRYHNKTIHNFERNVNFFEACKCSLCSFTCHKIVDFISHYNNEHNKNLLINQKRFLNHDEFKMWKLNMEKDNIAKYVLQRTKKTPKNTIDYYYCNRSGRRREVPKPKRCRKSQGSCKLNNYCTSFIKVCRDNEDATIVVDYCLDHSDHGCDLGHLSISEDMRCDVAGKLSHGIEPAKILEMIRDNITYIDRDSLITKKDIHNIKNQYNISTAHKHKNDACSTDMWINQLADEEYNPILFYKPQQSSHTILEYNDFLLCIQTKFQNEMMRKHGSKIICIDSTHSTTQYGFSLVSVLVLDDYEEAIPIAWAICNREDLTTLEIFTSNLRKVCVGDLFVNIFMSDMADAFYNAWITSFSKPYKRLYCSWHVDRCWRLKLKSLNNDFASRGDIYMLLKIVQNEVDERKFRQLLSICLTYIKEKNAAFYNYFNEHYVKNNKTLLWAACYRHGTLANTNMFVESFHNVLKSVYFSRKQNRRVDDLLQTLLKYARDRNLDQIIKWEKGKITHRLKEIRQRHKNSDSVNGIKEISIKEWEVPSSSQKNHYYKVYQDLSMPCNCKIKCDMCSTCIHMYTCECQDYLIKKLICKHIHAVHLTRNKNILLRCKKFDMLQQSKEKDTLLELKSFLQTSRSAADKSTEISKIKTIGLQKANKIINLLTNCIDINTVKAITGGLHDVYSIACGLKKNESINKVLTKTKHFAANKRFETQRRFVRTKKKTKKTLNVKLKKPNARQRDEIKKQLSGTEPSFCAMCFSFEDANGVTEYFECMSCKCTMHYSCNLNIGLGKEYQYLCPACRT